MGQGSSKGAPKYPALLSYTGNSGLPPDGDTKYLKVTGTLNVYLREGQAPDRDRTRCLATLKAVEAEFMDLAGRSNVPPLMRWVDLKNDDMLQEGMEYTDSGIGSWSPLHGPDPLDTSLKTHKFVIHRPLSAIDFSKFNPQQKEYLFPPFTQFTVRKRVPADAADNALGKVIIELEERMGNSQKLPYTNRDARRAFVQKLKGLAE